jgi:pimeloyl-ACP methyl ester carboxylesterase
MKAKLLFIILGIPIFSLSCNKDEEVKPEISVEAQNATDIIENGFKANWVAVENVEAYELQVCEASDYSLDILKYIIDGAENNFLQITDLKTYCNYYYRVRGIVSAGDTTDYSNSIFVTTNLLLKEVSFRTSDGINISATLKRKLNLSGDVPAIIFIHEGMSSKSEWVYNEFFNKIVDQGYVAFAYDIRGHGDSGGVFDMTALTSDPNQMPLDLDAAINYVKNIDGINISRIGIIGGSLGACLATGATKKYEEVKVAVALTAVKYIVNNLFGTSGFHHVYYITGEIDMYGPDAPTLYNITESPKKIDIVAGSGDHGVTLINNSRDLFNSAYDWLVKYLE